MAKRVWKAFDELTARELYELLKLRQDVFVLEQECLYPELDDVDLPSVHLLVRDGRGRLAGCARIVPPGAKYREPSIGRLAVRKDARGTGLGREIMAAAVDKCRKLHPGRTIRIQAQQYLESFYATFGFVPATAPYDEAGIMHVEMLLYPEAPQVRRKPKASRTVKTRSGTAKTIRQRHRSRR